MIASLREFDQQWEGTNRGLDELRDDAIDNLKLFEFWLRRVADAEEGRSLQLAGSDRVPEEYRRLVDEYFRALAERAPGQR